MFFQNSLCGFFQNSFSLDFLHKLVQIKEKTKFSQILRKISNDLKCLGGQ